MWSWVSGNNFRQISSLFAELKNVEVLKNVLCFMMGFFPSHGNMCPVLLIDAFFAKDHTFLGPINACKNVEINRYKIDDFRKHAKIVWFIWRHGTQIDASRLIGMSIRNILQPTWSLYDFRFKRYGSNNGFHVFGYLDLDLWPILYLFSHQGGMTYWSLYAKFHKNLFMFNGWSGRGHKHTTHTHTRTMWKQ